MISKRQFERALALTRSHGEKVALVGALLARDARLTDRLVVVGGSAISIYTQGAYVSKDLDIVASARKLEPSLRRWGFHRAERGARTYWVRDDLGLLIDNIDRADYVGLNDATRVAETRSGPVRVAALEDLIVRRLVFAKRSRRRALLDQATLLWIRFGEDLDSEYMAYHARFEEVEDLFREVIKRGRARRMPPARGVRATRGN